MMKLSQVDRVVFYDFTHSYILDGEKVLDGVTGLMKKHHLSPNYSGIDSAVLQHAADLGTAAHGAIESYCNGETTPEIPLIKSFKKLGLNIIATEYLVTDYEVVASSIDLVSQVDDNTVDLLDMKRTSTVHKDAVTWQLSIYKYLFERENPGIKVRNLYCLPIKKGNKDDILKDTCSNLVQVIPIDDSKIEALLQAEKEGRIYQEEGEDENALEVKNTIEGFLSVGLADSLKLIADLQAQVKEVEENIASAKEQIYQEMLAKGVDRVVVDGVSISLKKPYQSPKFDTKSFKEDYPDLAEQYIKTTEVKGNITVKIK